MKITASHVAITYTQCIHCKDNHQIYQQLQTKQTISKLTGSKQALQSNKLIIGSMF